MFCNHKYSVFAGLGNLKKYTFNVKIKKYV